MPLNYNRIDKIRENLEKMRASATTPESLLAEVEEVVEVLSPTITKKEARDDDGRWTSDSVVVDHHNREANLQKEEAHNAQKQLEVMLAQGGYAAEIARDIIDKASTNVPGHILPDNMRARKHTFFEESSPESEASADLEA